MARTFDLGSPAHYLTPFPATIGPHSVLSVVFFPSLFLPLMTRNIVHKTFDPRWPNNPNKSPLKCSSDGSGDVDFVELSAWWHAIGKKWSRRPAALVRSAVSSLAATVVRLGGLLGCNFGQKRKVRVEAALKEEG